jgi:hypothetical protein
LLTERAESQQDDPALKDPKIPNNGTNDSTDSEIEA